MPACARIQSRHLDPPVRNYLQLLQAYRGLAAIAVLVYHLGLLAERRIGTELLAGLTHAGEVGVDFFFVLSGFIILHIHWRDLGRADTGPRYLAKRVFRIYPILLIITGVKFAYALAGGGGIEEDALSPEKVIASFLLIPLSPGDFPMITVAWTLMHEMLFYLVFLLAILYGHRFAAVLGLAWAAATVALQLGWGGDLSGMPGFVFSSYNLQFLLGCSVVLLLRRDWITPRIALVLIAAAAAMLVAGTLALDHVLAWSQLGQRLFWGVAFALLVAGSVAWENRRRTLVPRSVCLMGDASYSIYLVHSQVQMAGVVVAERLGWIAPGQGLAVLIVIGAASLIGGVVFWALVERPILKHSRRWLDRLLPGKVDQHAATKLHS